VLPSGCTIPINWTDTSYLWNNAIAPANPDSVWVSFTSEGVEYDVELLPNGPMQNYINTGLSFDGDVSTSNPNSMAFANYNACATIPYGAFGSLIIKLIGQGCDDEALYNVSWLLEIKWTPNDDCTGPVAELVVLYGLVRYEPRGVYNGIVYSHAATTQSDLVAAGTFEWQQIGTNYGGTVSAYYGLDISSFALHETYL
jgi:hypothetical protein